jgi:SsrA-binding protein
MRSSEEFERSERVIVSNRKARHDYLISSTIEAGILLQGTEVKSLRQGRASMQDAYAGFKSKNDYELWLHNLHINEYDFGNRENHKPKRDRKLLINHKEALKLKTAVMEKGMTLIPLSLYFSGHLVKVEIGIARAKKKFDKRESEKEREQKREIDKKFKFR